MPSLNKVLIMGNLVADPEQRTFKGGSVTNLRMAVNERYKTKAGEAKEIVTYCDVQVWGAQGEACLKHLGKGDLTIVDGKLRLQEWEKDGQKRSKMVIQAERVTFLSTPAAGAGPGRPSQEGRRAAKSEMASTTQAPAETQGDFMGDETPF